ncbi:MAG: cupin domain-containing protein, partial [Ktedonobacterales bacterium]
MVDVLSDTLRVVRLTGAVFLEMRLTTPWVIQSEPPGLLAQYLRLPSDCLAQFHILVRGQCLVRVQGYTPALLGPGDAILLPHSAPHIMSSGHRMTLSPTPMRYLLPSQASEGITLYEGNGSGAPTQFICGYLHCDQRFNPLLGALPALIVANRHDHDPEDDQDGDQDDKQADGALTALEGGVAATPVVP